MDVARIQSIASFIPPPPPKKKTAVLLSNRLDSFFLLVFNLKKRTLSPVPRPWPSNKKKWKKWNQNGVVVMTTHLPRFLLACRVRFWNVFLFFFEDSMACGFFDVRFAWFRSHRCVVFRLFFFKFPQRSTTNLVRRWWQDLRTINENN